MLSLQRQISWLGRIQWSLAALVAVLCAGFYLFCYRPQTRQLGLLNTRITDCQRELSSNREQTKVLGAVERDVADLKQRLSQFKELPQQTELARFFKDVATLAQQAALRKPDIKQEQVIHGGRLNEVPLKMAFEGDFIKVYSFLHDAEQLPRLTRVPAINIKGKDKQGQVRVEMTMSIYCAAD
jgi:Tfp pilus assembly protein PilO